MFSTVLSTYDDAVVAAQGISCALKERRNDTRNHEVGWKIG